jgi:MFS family permease
MSDSPSVKLGPLQLAPGIRLRHAWSFFGVAFLSIGLMTFIAVGQTYVLNVNLGIPDDQQGGITGDLIAWTEVVALLLFIPAGILVDRVSRRAVYAAGFLLLGRLTFCIPSPRRWEVFLYRCTVYALGFVAVTAALSTVLVDYPSEPSRGKLVALVGFLCGLGVATIQGFGALPETFAGMGYSDLEAGQITHFIIAGSACSPPSSPGSGSSRASRSIATCARASRSCSRAASPRHATRGSYSPTPPPSSPAATRRSTPSS